MIQYRQSAVVDVDVVAAESLLLDCHNPSLHHAARDRASQVMGRNLINK